MANESMAQLRRQIAAVETRLQNERREIKDALRSTPRLLKATLTSRTAMAAAFIAAAVAGAVLAMRHRSVPRSRRG
jgi:hypothetical protein